MSQENVETVRRCLDALVATQDGERWDAVLAELDPQVEIEDFDIVLDSGPDAGHEAFQRWIGIWNDAWEAWRIENPEIRPVGNDRAIALFRMIATGRGSGIQLERDDAVVYTLRDGKIVSLGYYNDQHKALEAVGLSE